ncbi:Guanine-nucleotide dissociation stimulator CDC25 domain-containing protein [Rozella allomycis CSF55]|uniref:Guanine-nucleotide dissociation stimulator CDC25 domain-containing protein n=1 Tax=Rozella allomycis (strain CSF55) TaxID=988480 RepID=A0A075ATS5_ROZAC|nr:Guanine-nucleotide dissociation stimulator CDC25 domain-containing protein [Rozella allomycis CSF55]|eukprot:EPZ33648.1 Guanine-nucleotide dissociation stimulator CDC25 domain-containing protein [Rozella allomycis CSF55]
MTPLSYASFLGDPEILNILLSSESIDVNAQDEEGNTALHIAVAAAKIESIIALINAKANPYLVNALEKSPIDYASDKKILKILMNATIEYVDSQVPQDVAYLRDYIVEVIVNFYKFQERTKDIIVQVVEEKQIAVQKYNSIEGLLGLKDNANDKNHINRFAYLQDENERQAAKINYLKLQNRNLVKKIEELRMGYRENVNALSSSHLEEIELLQKKDEEISTVITNYQTKISTISDELLKSIGGRSILSFSKDSQSKEDYLIKSINSEKMVFDQQIYRMLEEKRNLIHNLKRNEDSIVIQSNSKREQIEQKLQDLVDKQEQQDELNNLVAFIHVEEGATLEKLAEYLLDPRRTQDEEFESTFLLCYRCFTTKLVLLKQILACFELSFVKFSERPLPEFSEIVPQIQLKYVNILKNWMQNHWLDFEGDDQFITETNKVIEQNNERFVVVSNIEPPPKPIIPKTLIKKFSGDPTERLKTSLESINLKLIDIDPLEVARQITLIEHKLFLSIKPYEFLNLAWMKDDRDVKSPNIMAMTRFSNHIVNWVITEIVTIKENLKLRAAAFEKFIQVAQTLSAKLLKTYDDLNNVASSDLNFKNLRSRVQNAEPPVIPFPGLFQGDLVYLDTCNKDKLENGLINFTKQQKIYLCIQEIQSYQKSFYNLEVVDDIADYIKNINILYSSFGMYILTLQESEVFSPNLFLALLTIYGADTETIFCLL